MNPAVGTQTSRWPADTGDVSKVRLPGPLVFISEVPADPTDLTGGMTWSDMVNVLAEIEPVAAVVAGHGARYHYAVKGGRVNDRAWAEDPPLPCCAGTVTFVEHRLHWWHTGWLFADVLTTAIEEERQNRIADGDALEEIALAEDDILDDIEARCWGMCHAIDAAPPRTQTVDSYYRIPFVALDVPEERIQAYERAQIGWPEALTFEMYGPPESDAALAAFEADEPGPAMERSGPVRFGSRRGHLALVL